MEISSEAKKSHTKFELKLLDINESRIEVPEIEMTTITTLPSTDFQRLCRDMSNIGADIEITREGKKIDFKCEGDFANQETSIECLDESQKNHWYVQSKIPEYLYKGDEYVCVCANYTRNR